MEVTPEIALVIVLVAMTASILMSMRLDRARIKRTFEGRGAAVLSMRWLPFGRGWLGSLHETIYEVRYRRADGTDRKAIVHTSVLTGVHLEQDEDRSEGPS